MDAESIRSAALQSKAWPYEEARKLLNRYPNGPDKGAIISFELQGIHAHDVSMVIDRAGVAVRAGTHCAQPLLARYGVTSTCRASFGLYNTRDEVDALVRARELELAAPRLCRGPAVHAGQIACPRHLPDHHERADVEIDFLRVVHGHTNPWAVAHSR